MRNGSTEDAGKRLAFFILALVAGIGIALLPAPGPGAESAPPLTLEGKNLAALFLLCLILWASEAIPIAITALLALVLQPLFRITSLKTAFSAFMSPVFFFIVAMFIVAAVIVHTGLARRFALLLLERAGADARRILLALMIGTALLSTIMSDIPACAVFMAVGLGVLSRSGDSPGAARFAKALMMGIPIAAMIGGVATPAGSSVNVLSLDMLEVFSREHGTDINISFLQWMAIGVPTVVILIPVAWWILSRLCPPSLQIGVREEIRAERAELGGIKPAEWKALAIQTIMIVLWIAGSWVEALDVTMVSMMGAIVMFMPGIRLIDWKTAERQIGWHVLLMVGGLTSLGTASVKTGLADWLVVSVMGGAHDWNVLWVIALICAFTVIVHLPMPIGPAVAAALIPPVASLAIQLEISPALCVLPVAFMASCAFLLPLNPVVLLTYTKGHYRMHEMLLPGGAIAIVWIALMTLLTYFIGPMILG